MHRPPKTLLARRSILALALCALPALAIAQANTGTPAQQGAAEKKDPGALKVLNLPDYGRWNRITATAISATGVPR